MSDADKQALEQNTAAIKCELTVLATDTLPSILLTEDNSVKDWEYTDERIVPGQGFIGQFVARTLNGNLDNISNDFDISNRTINFKLGIYRMNDNVTTWYDYGNFLVVDPNNDEVRDNTKFETMDYAKLFNKTFDGDYTDTTFTTSYNARIANGDVLTPLWVAQYACAQVGIELATTTFANYNTAIIDINPFQAGESCRDVIKAIAQLAFSWARIGWDNRCYIDFALVSPSNINQYDVLDNNQYFSLSTKELFKPVDGVGFGMKNIDGETAFKLDNVTIENANNIIYLYDNPFLYTYEKRYQAVQQANVLFGLTYMQLETETIGHPWLLGNELINVKDMENDNNYTYPFNRTLKYGGHIRSKISSYDESEIDSTLGYTSSMETAIRNATIEVNKQNGTITSLTESVQIIDTRENNNYQQLLGKFGDYAPLSEITDIRSSVTQLQTDTYTKTEVQQIANGIGVNGVKVSAVISTSGTFDENGMTYEKTNAQTKTTINEVGVNVKNINDTSLMFAGYVNASNTDYSDYLNQTIVGTENIIVKNYLNIGTHSRIQDYENGTGIFYR